MKRNLKLFVLVVCFGMFLNVNAIDYGVKTLIPINESANIKTDYFTYNGISYGGVDSSGHTLFNFSSITNNSGNRRANYISIDILLFDGDKKNIGFITYCSKSDLDSDYNGYTLKNGASTSYSVQVLKKYFIDGKSLNNIKYYSVLDDNRDCRNGGYNKYAGLTIEEITNGSVSNSYKPKSIYSFGNMELPDLSNISSKVIAIATSISVLVIIGILIIQGLILNSLHKKIFFEGTIFAYLPVANIYIMFKLAFGKILAFIFTLFCCFSVYLYFSGNRVLFYISLFILMFAFLLDIIKLITKKYTLLYFDSKRENNNSFNRVNKVTEYDDNNTSSYINRDKSLLNNNSPSLIDDGNKQVDLNYGNNDNNNQLSNNGNSSKRNDEDSDLSKMFR